MKKTSKKKKFTQYEISSYFQVPRSTFFLWQENRPFMFTFLTNCYKYDINEINFDDEEELKLIKEFINLSKDEKKKLLANP